MHKPFQPVKLYTKTEKMSMKATKQARDKHGRFVPSPPPSERESQKP